MNDRTSQERKWIEDYCNGLISPDQFEHFQDALEESPELRREFRRYLALDTGLRLGSEVQEDVQSAWAPQPAMPAPGKITASPRSWQWAALAALVVVGVGFFIATRPSPPSSGTAQRGEDVEPSAQGFGVLMGSDGARWESHPDLEQGDLLPSGRIRLTSGTAQLELFSGVTLVVEGTATFEILSAMEMSVSHGKLRANVPEPAQGFRIRSAGGQLVDLGTEFAVNITADKSEVHVIDGAVEWHSSTQPDKELMTEGEALSWGPAGTTRRLPAREGEFMSLEEFNERLDRGRSSRRNRWLAHCRELARDERLVAYFPMSHPGQWHRRLLNEAPPGGAASDGAIVAAKRASDRFGHGDGALDFSATGSRVRLKVEEELSSLTLLAWVKIDSLDRWYNSLFLTDGHELHEPHWQIMNDGRLFFSVKRRNYDRAKKIKDKHVVYSEPFWTPSMSGKWTQIATTYDTSTYTVCHYINGRQIHEEVLPENMRVDRVKIGPATIGNWSEPTRHDSAFSVRNLNGSMDEFAIFSAALNAHEIADLYRNGKP